MAAAVSVGLMLSLFAIRAGRAAAVERTRGFARPARIATLPAPVPCPTCWEPALMTSWQWQLQGTIDTSLGVQMYDVDMFDTSAAAVSALHSAGAHVICYIDAGTWENWRPDASQFPASILGRSNGWPGERWLDVRRLKVLEPIMLARIQTCAKKGFDGVEFDNVDGYQNNTGFPITSADQLRYDVWLANEAHSYDLSVALKNDLGQAKILLPYFDFALDEQCFQYKECNRLSPFIAAGKAVFEVEYKLDTSQFCSQANSLDFNSMRKRLSLRVWRQPCR
jgi:hypothetical protein